MSDAKRSMTMRCNGAPQEVEAPGDRLLIDVLRQDLGLTGTKLGCGTGDCGACTVLIDDQPVNSCLVYAIECEGSDVRTIEDVSRDGPGRAVAEAFVRAGAVQCGICTPGLVVMATSFVESLDAPPDRRAVEVALGGNLCRCTGYLPIVRAVLDAAERVRSSEGAA